MRPVLRAFAILSLLVFPASQATAQATKTVKGTVSAVAADSVTVKAGTSDMKFGVDNSTKVVAPGAGTQARAAQRAGRAGAKVTDVLKVGQAVEVSYHDMGGGNMHAAEIRAIASVGDSAPTSANGTVATISSSSLTINGTTSGGGTFTQTYAIDANTKVVGQGAGTATARSGGRAVVTDLVKAGDKVVVSFSNEGGSMKATEIRVTAKAAK